MKGGKKLKKYPVLQEEASDCGVCCLLSIIRYYNGNANLEKLRIDSLTTNKGVSAYNLIECAKKNGFNAKGYKDKSLSNYKLPSIIHFQINKSLSHFVVLYEIKDGKYTVMDPAIGYKKLSEEEFMSKFTGYFIILEPLGVLPNMKNDNVVKKKITQQFTLNKKHLKKIIIYNLFYLILSVISSFYINIYKYKSYLIFLIVCFIFINILLYVITNIVYRKLLILVQKINYNLSNNFFEHIFKLPLKYLHLKDPGEIVKRTEEISVINELLVNSIISTILNLFLICGVVPLIIYFMYELLLPIILVFVLSFIFTLLILRPLKQKSNKAVDSTTDYNNYLIDTIYGLTSIKHTKSEEYIKDNLLNVLQKKNEENYNYNYFVKNYETVKDILLSLLRLIINLYLIKQIYAGNFTFESLIILDMLIEILINSLSNVLSFLTDLLFVKNLFSKANDFYNIPTLTTNNQILFQNGTITITNLKYNYYNNHPLINNFTTNILIGEKVIIKGESGCGKSTLCKIINREIDDYEGSIKINDIDIKDINYNSYRDNIIYSSQSEKIFTGTIQDNILMGRTISDDRLTEIIKICELKRILNKKTFGLDTFLYGGGEELSGGERQLIILARTLVNDFNILILDETLSEVNDMLEDKILENIFTYYKDKTIIYVSHKNKKNYFKRVINV